MLSDAMTALIRGEQSRQEDRFIEGVVLEDYLQKLHDRAEIVCAAAADGRCRGLVAFYCNDAATRRAFITLVVVDPIDRGTGLGRQLVGEALAAMKGRGFASCRLEVARENTAAHSLYTSMGFRPVDANGRKDVMEIRL